MRKIRAFCGYEGSGKSYSTQRLTMTRGFKHLAFADALRDITFKTVGIPFDKGMKKYEDLKKLEFVNGLTFRNLMENLAAGVRRYDKDFWAKTVLTLINECTDNIAISDLRYSNEHMLLKEYSSEYNVDYKLVFCDFHSDRYREDNPHESTLLARYLKGLGYQDQQYVDSFDIETFASLEEPLRDLKKKYNLA